MLENGIEEVLADGAEVLEATLFGIPAIGDFATTNLQDTCAR